LKDHFKLNIDRNDKSLKFILYLHGTTGDRSNYHRCILYEQLSQLGLHVIALDYRGYGDSTGDPTEENVVKDALFTYEYFLKLAPHATFYIWGHSLGTG
jgi:pimeloyl-ACP methyl ester carboxylesterase